MYRGETKANYPYFLCKKPSFTPPKTSISSEKSWLEDDVPFEMVPFFWWHVSFQCNKNVLQSNLCQGLDIGPTFTDNGGFSWCFESFA